ncbi:MAG: rhodanese-like domain-containing protein [Desulfoferrobacter sp.]
MKRWYRLSVIFANLILFAICIMPVAAAEIEDTESATHDDSAASYQVVDVYQYPGFKVIQFDLPVLSHYSYLLISGNQALVVDPGRDVSVYIDTASKEGAKIVGVFLTHSHADFVAGHMELAKVTHCPIYVNRSSGAEYSFVPLQEGSSLEIGKALIRFVETPGHTPDGLCGYVFSQEDKSSPKLIFTGDTLFVGSVGRPDLLEGNISAAALASMMYDSWNNKLAKAGDRAVIFPAHGAGSLCGAHLSDQPSSTIGAEKASNSYLQYTSRSEFVTALLQGLPEAPQYFKHNAALNRRGPDVVDWDAALDRIAPEKALTDIAKYYVVDLRDQRAYAAGHIPNSVNIALRGRLETWVGTMVPWQSKTIICGSENELKEAAQRLLRVGYQVTCIDMQAWEQSGLPQATSSLIEPRELYDLMKKNEAPVIVDVRLPEEWMGVRIGTVLNLPLSHLAELSVKLDPSMPTLAVCNSAYRSSLAVGILQRQGFKKVSSLAGGTQAWIDAGLPVYGNETKSGATGASLKPARRHIKLPDRISADALMRLMQDLPGTFDLVDIRPAEHFNDYHLPGSQSIDIGELLNNPTYLTGVGPLIIADRDGSLAMAVAGILVQKTDRPIKVLYGGVEAYWAESEFNSAVREVGIIQGGSSTEAPTRSAPQNWRKQVPSIEQKPENKTGPPSTAPRTPKKKSAGC